MGATEQGNLSELQFDATLRGIEHASHPPGAIYSSDAVFELEKRNIFMKSWLPVARVEELEKPGDYLAIRVVGEPVLLVRNHQDRIRAFANVCLHRGVEVASDSGNVKHFSCPYHAWQYDLDGNLDAASFMQHSQGFDFKSSQLKSLHVDTWAGWVFVNLAPDARPLADAISEFAADVGFLKMENLRLGTKITLDLPTNWKFVVENLMDIYHVRTLHYKSFGKHRGPPENYPFHLRKNGGTCTQYTAAPMTPDGVSRFGKMPALESYEPNFALSSHFAPNMQVIARIDNVHPLVMWPLTATTSRTYVYNLYPKEWFDQPDFAEKIDVYDRYMRLVLAEDVEMMNSMQNGITSENYVPGRFCTLEKGIHHVLNDYIGRVFGASPRA